MARLNYKDIYYFRYKAKGAETKSLHVYDRNPLVIFLEVRSKVALGVNIHWIPRNFRRAFLQTVLATADKIGNGPRKKIILRLLYASIKSNPKLSKMALGAIRIYIIQRISGMKMVPPEKWNTIIGNPKYRERKLYREKGYKRK